MPFSAKNSPRSIASQSDATGW